MAGPLSGLRVLEFAGLGPAPFCGMLLADLGADVLRVDRPGASYDRFTVEQRGKRSIVLDLKSESGRETALALAEKADALIEGFRPGVMERLGLGPEIVLSRNPKIVYGRMTGWGQTGPLARAPGHDIDYIALSGALHAVGPRRAPAIPLNLVGDFGGGALYLAVGVLAAAMHARETGEGQVVDCAMTDGSAHLMSMLYGHLARGTWRDKRAANIIDGGSHFYNVYQCKDGAWIAVGAIEPQFYADLLRRAEIEDPDLDAQMDQARWPALKKKLASLFKTRARAEWLAVLEGTDACVAPVLSMTEAPDHPHNVARGTFVEVDGVRQPAPAPRLSGTPADPPRAPTDAGEGGEAALRDWGVDREDAR